MIKIWWSPSPSYLLDNCYEFDEDQYIHHIDLYRLPVGCDLGILDIPDIFLSALCVIEWPDRIQPAALPESYLDINFKINQDTQSRNVQLSAVGPRWQDRKPLLLRLCASVR